MIGLSSCSGASDLSDRVLFGISEQESGTGSYTVSSSTGGYSVNESGGTLTLSIVLDAIPASDVKIPLSSSNTAEATVSVTDLTFTATNWNEPQTFVVTGTDEYIKDGNQDISVTFGEAESTDSSYSGATHDALTITVIDNETPGITISPTSGLATTEAGGTATFTVVLNSQPHDGVSLSGMSINDDTEVSIDRTSLSFTTTNWNTPQTVLLTGVDDYVVDGDKDISVSMPKSSSSDSDYNQLTLSTVTGKNTDNDSYTVSVSPVTSLITTEAGGTATYQVVLNAKPTDDVTINTLTVGDTTEVSSSTTGPITFTTSNWNTPQTITLTGVDDSVDDGDISYTISHSNTVSTDSSFNDVTVPSVTGTTTDDDTAGITVTTGTTTISEAYGTMSITVVLTSEPTADVVISASSSNTTGATLDKSSITFTSGDWNTPQVITVTGADELVMDGDQNISITFGSVSSTDPKYSGKTLSTIDMTVLDDDISISVYPATLTTSEASGSSHTATFYVSLSNAPTDTVTVPSITVGDTTEGSVDKSSLVFTTANWNTPQAVTVTGGSDEPAEDGNITYYITLGNAVSSDTSYSGKTVGTGKVTVTNTDASAAFVVSPLSISIVEATTAECSDNTWGSCSDSFTVKLKSAPTCSVVVAVASDSATRATVNKSSLTFTTSNWDTAQTVTVTSKDDSFDGGSTAVNISLTYSGTGCGYDGKDPDDVTVNIDDNDAYGIRVSNMNQHTTEATPPSTGTGTTGSFKVKLNKQPAIGKTVTIPISDTYDSRNYNHVEGTADKTSLTFTDSNWNVEQTVTVTPTNDYVADGDIQYVIVLMPANSDDASYNGKDPRDVTVVNENKDTLGINYIPGSSGGTEVETATGTYTGYATDDNNQMGSSYSTFRLRLRSKPTADVTLNFLTVLSTSDTTSTSDDGTLSSSSFTFTTSNWDQYQTLSVTGNSDGVNTDGNRNYYVKVGSITTSDTSGYSTIGTPLVKIYSCDNDGTNELVMCAKSSGPDTTTTESGGTASFWIIGKSSCDATVGLSVDDTTEGSVASSISITSSNYNTLESGGSNLITVTGVQDSPQTIDGTVTYHLLTAAASGTGSCNGFDLPSYTLKNSDANSRYITSTSGSAYENNTAQASVGLKLGAQPAGTVTFSVSCSDSTECQSVSPTTLSYTSSSGAGGWDEYQYVTVTGQDDSIADGNQTVTVTFTVTSGDTTVQADSYELFPTSGTYSTTTKTVTNVDDENAMKRIYITASTYTAEQSGITGADAICNGSDSNKPSTGTYKALLVGDSTAYSHSSRVATTTGTDSTGQTNWVLAATTQYYLTPYTVDDSKTYMIFETDANKLFDPSAMALPFTTSGSDTFWTGMNANLTTSTTSGAKNNCDGWEYNNDPNSTFADYYGTYWTGNVTDYTSTAPAESICNNARKFICVQQ